MFLNRIDFLQEKFPAAEKKPLRLVLPYLGTTVCHCKLDIKVRNFCKLQVIFRGQNKLCNSFRFEDPVPQILTSVVVYKLQSGLRSESYCGEYLRHLVVKNGEHVSVSFLTNERVQPRRHSAVCNHLLNCNYSLSLKILVFCVEAVAERCSVKNKIL